MGGGCRWEAGGRRWKGRVPAACIDEAEEEAWVRAPLQRSPSRTPGKVGGLALCLCEMQANRAVPYPADGGCGYLQVGAQPDPSYAGHGLLILEYSCTDSAVSPSPFKDSNPSPSLTHVHTGYGAPSSCTLGGRRGRTNEDGVWPHLPPGAGPQHPPPALPHTTCAAPACILPRSPWGTSPWHDRDILTPGHTHLGLEVHVERPLLDVSYGGSHGGERAWMATFKRLGSLRWGEGFRWVAVRGLHSRNGSRR